VAFCIHVVLVRESGLKGRFAHQSDTESRTPSARGALKPGKCEAFALGEAPAKRLT
jgi:hypothetical protein